MDCGVILYDERPGGGNEILCVEDSAGNSPNYFQLCRRRHRANSHHICRGIQEEEGTVCVSLHLYVVVCVAGTVYEYATGDGEAGSGGGGTDADVA